MNRYLHATVTTLLATLALGAALTAGAGNDLLGELRLVASTEAEKRAGVWVDDQYLGYLGELKGNRKVLLLPGEHRLSLRLAGYQKLDSRIQLEAGGRKTYRVTMRPDPDAVYAETSRTGAVRISVEPERAAVFVDGRYAGYVEAFSHRGGLRLSEGRHRFRIALPGYKAFETELLVHAGQRYEVKTKLVRDAGATLLSESDRHDAEDAAAHVEDAE